MRARLLHSWRRRCGHCRRSVASAVATSSSLSAMASRPAWAEGADEYVKHTHANKHTTSEHPCFKIETERKFGAGAWDAGVRVVRLNKSGARVVYLPDNETFASAHQAAKDDRDEDVHYSPEMLINGTRAFNMKKLKQRAVVSPRVQPQRRPVDLGRRT